MITRANDLGMKQEIQEDVSCCFAVQDKTWIKGPDNDWEIYYVKGDAPDMAPNISNDVSDEASGWPAVRESVPATAPQAKSACC